MNKYIKIPLKAACNHRLIVAQQPNNKDDVGLDGLYINEADFKFTNNAVIDEVEFDINIGKYDNVECAEQAIEIDASADKLHVFGFALWGDTYSVFKIVYENGVEDYVTVPFINWTHTFSFNWFDMSSVGGNIASHGVIASGEQVAPVYIHHITVDLPKHDKIKSIILPDNFCLHIMAITLENVANSQE